MPYSNPVEQREYQRKWLASRRREYLEMRGNECEKCTSKEDLEFHHRNKNEKLDHKIWSWSRKRIEEELLKCDLLCSKCHLGETVKERSWKVYTHGTITCYHATKCRCEPCRAENARVQLLNKYARQRLKEVVSDAGAAPAISTDFI